jgi:protein-tyrosine-phosphatase
MTTDPDRPTILFVCVHNAGRSQMAAGYLRTEVVAESDVVITMGCGDACPIFPGKRYEDWELDDPAGADLAAVRGIRDQIRQRVDDLVQGLSLG